MPLFRGEGGGLLRLPETNKLMRAPTGECCCEECDCCVAFKDVTLAGGFVINDIGVQSTSDMTTHMHETAYCEQQTLTIRECRGMQQCKGILGLLTCCLILSLFRHRRLSIHRQTTDQTKLSFGITITQRAKLRHLP